MKFPILVALLLILYPPTPSTAAQENKKPKQAPNDIKNNTNPNSDFRQDGVNVNVVFGTPQTRGSADHGQEKENKKSSTDWWLAGFTGALVIVGVLQWCVLRKHEKWMKRNVRVVTKIALAAKQSAAAMSNSERAWITASPPEPAPQIGYISPPGPPEAARTDTRNYFAALFKNEGRTPAIRENAAVVYRLFNQLNDIPPDPDYGARGRLNDVPLAPGGSIKAFAFLQPNVILPYDVAQAVFRQGAFLLAYGVIAYRDVFERKHETRFGYIYHLPQGGDPIPSGFRTEKVPATYNRAT